MNTSIRTSSAAFTSAIAIPQREMPRREMPLMQAPKKHQRRRRKRYRVNRDPKMRTGSPRRARKSPNRPSKSRCSPRRSPKKTNPKRRRNGNRNKTWISPPNISPKRQSRFGITLLTRSQTVSMTRKKQRIKTTKKCPEQTKKQNKTANRLQKLRIQRKKPKFPQSPTLPNVLRNEPKMQSSPRRTSLPKTEGIPTEAAVRKE